MTSKKIVAIVLVCFLTQLGAKVYERCELARELVESHEIPMKQIASWICIVQHESNYNTSAINKASGDHGLFQISNLFWCSPPGRGFACALPCSSFEDDDIEDDVVCARRIYRAHQRMTGDGFSAWVAYNHYCSSGRAKKYIENCFNSIRATTEAEEPSQTLTGSEALETTSSSNVPTLVDKE